MTGVRCRDHFASSCTDDGSAGWAGGGSGSGPVGRRAVASWRFRYRRAPMMGGRGVGWGLRGD